MGYRQLTTTSKILKMEILLYIKQHHNVKIFINNIIPHLYIKTLLDNIIVWREISKTAGSGDINWHKLPGNKLIIYIISTKNICIL